MSFSAAHNLPLHKVSHVIEPIPASLTDHSLTHSLPIASGGGMAVPSDELMTERQDRVTDKTAIKKQTCEILPCAPGCCVCLGQDEVDGMDGMPER